MDQKKLLYSILPCNSRIPLRRTKSTVLRSIFGEIEDAMVSEKILDYLETIGEVDRLQGLCILESMKKAYCTVAVECTVRYLSIDSNSKGKYVEVVERIWRNRIRNLEKSRISELLSDELTEAWEEIEAAVWDENVCSRLRERNTRNSALISVIAYLEECSEYTGDEKEQEGKDKETRSLEVRRVLEARKDSSLELQAAATDLITEALYVAEFIAQEMTRENAIGEVVDVEEGTMEASHAEEAGKTACEQVLDDEEGNMEAGRAKEAATSMPSSSQSNASRGSLMERNNSTQTYEKRKSLLDSLLFICLCSGMTQLRIMMITHLEKDPRVFAFLVQR